MLLVASWVLLVAAGAGPVKIAALQDTTSIRGVLHEQIGEPVQANIDVPCRFNVPLLVVVAVCVLKVAVKRVVPATHGSVVRSSHPSIPLRSRAERRREREREKRSATRANTIKREVRREGRVKREHTNQIVF